MPVSSLPTIGGIQDYVTYCRRRERQEFVDFSERPNAYIRSISRSEIVATDGPRDHRFPYVGRLTPDDWSDLKTVCCPEDAEELVAAILENLLYDRGHRGGQAAIARAREDGVSLAGCVECSDWDAVVDVLEELLQAIPKRAKQPLLSPLNDCETCSRRIPRRITKTQAVVMAGKAFSTISKYLKDHDSTCLPGEHFVGPDGQLDFDRWYSHITSPKWKSRCRNRRKGSCIVSGHFDLEDRLCDDIGAMILTRARAKDPPTTENIITVLGHRHRVMILQILERDYHQDQNGCWWPEKD